MKQENETKRVPSIWILLFINRVLLLFFYFYFLMKSAVFLSVFFNFS